MATLYLDESKAKNYVFIGVLVQDGDAPRLRKRVASLKLPGQRSIHFVNEGDSRRKKLIQEYSDLGVAAVKVISHRKNKLEAREDCIRALAHLAASMECHSLVFDRDESVITKDEQWLKSELRKVDKNVPIGFNPSWKRKLTSALKRETRSADRPEGYRVHFAGPEPCT